MRTALRARSAGRPRLSVHRTGKHIYAQIIDDGEGRTLAAANSLGAKGADIDAAAKVGADLAAAAKQAGVTAVVIPKDKSAPVNATVRKTSAGAADRIPVVRVTNLARSLETLKQAGVWMVGLAGEATQSLYAVDLKGPIGIVMGGEGEGMRRLTREHCDYLAQIPMTSAVESLNVSVATGIALFEVRRQRSA